MNYTKPALSIQQQIQKLKDRGLTFGDENRAAHYLSNISYYRLRAYTYPFQNNTDPNHPFTQATSFEDIIGLYVFDRRLRILVFNAIEKIEIAIRTKIIYEFSIVNGSHWYENAIMYQNNYYFRGNVLSITNEIDRSKEDFILHYKSTYTNPVAPPAWMSLEVVSMGLLSLVFSNLKELPEKRRVINEFGHVRYDIFISWVHAFVGLRNVCAHHSRLWNRRFTISPTIPYNLPNQFLNNRAIQGNKLYTLMSCMNYILRIISPGNSFVTDLKALLSTSPLIDLHEMGFPADWINEVIWQA
jgi:abortive infection bacteriophage resistance protein